MRVITILSILLLVFLKEQPSTGELIPQQAHCFGEGTRIMTPSGSKEIEKIQVNDVIVTFNERRNRLDKSTVLSITKNSDQQLYLLNFQGNTITVTDDHPFYYKGNFFSLKATSLYGFSSKKMEINQKILFLEKNKWVEKSLTSIEPIKKKDNSYTISKLSSNRLFFANNACVAVETIPSTFAKK